MIKAYLQIVIIIEDLKNYRDLKNWEMSKTEVNTLVKRESNLQWF